MTPRTGSTPTAFKNNELAIEAGLQAENYGKTPAEIMHATDLSPADRFWLNAQVRAATAQFKQRKQEEAQGAHTSAGTATPQQERELHERQDERAQTRESMQEAGMNAPSPDGQLQQLREVEQAEQEAESLLSGQSDGSDPDGGGV